MDRPTTEEWGTALTNTLLKLSSTRHNALRRPEGPSPVVSDNVAVGSHCGQGCIFGTHRARHVATALTQQEQHRCSILLRLTDSAQHVLVSPFISESSDSRSLTEWRIDMSRTEGVDSNRWIHFSRLSARVRICRRRSASWERVLRMSPLCSQ